MKTIATICLVVCSLCVLAQEPMMVEGKAISAKSAKKLIKEGKVFYLTAGTPIRGLSDAARQCRDNVQKEFGFSYYTVSGDLADPKKTKQISDFNAVVKKHLTCRNGADWEAKLDAKLEACNKQ